MEHTSSTITNLSTPSSRVKISLNLTWLVVIPAGLWAIATFYVPIFGAFLSVTQTWVVTLLIGLAVAVSLLGHVFAHIYAARWVGGSAPSTVSLFLFGDAAPAWPASTSARREAAAALAGPLFNLAIAGLGYLIWNAQLNVYLNLTMLFLCGFNIWLAIINLTPAFPLDGGRLVRVIFWGAAPQRARATRLSKNLGFLISAALIAWSVVLILQHLRFSLETGAVTMAYALLILAGLWRQPAWKDDAPAQLDQLISRRPIRTLTAGLSILIMLGVASSLLLTNEGLEAPGFALAVESMIHVSPEHRYTHSGSLILTSVVAQAPITAAEWLFGQLSPVVKIVPPARVVPENTTPQEQARQGFQMLDQSTTTAIVVGLRRAGYSADLMGKGVGVVSVQPDSQAQGLLQPGDVITGLNGTSIQTTSELIDQIKAQDPHTTVHLTIERNQHTLEVAVPLMSPTLTNTSPRLGIVIAPAGFDLKLPFPVQIVPEKIVGGPSAGLMFSLAVYNAVTPTDLTGGWKIAGTGTIGLDGTVGPIGGVEQKVAAAEAAGAEYFLSPVENYEDARAVAQHIQVVKIATIDQALAFLHNLSQP
jgi:PDZ domain-containing protein